MEISIRNEVESDYREVEVLTREAFWNLHVPGCDEHYLVHKMRTHTDFIPELDFVAIHRNKIIGNIMYSKAHIVDELLTKVEITTFGPISVLPSFQRKGVGSALISHTRQLAMDVGFKAIVIYGYPQNYCRQGYKSSKDLSISNSDSKFPYGLLALELETGFLKGHKWRYLESEVYSIDAKEAEEYDKLFKAKRKEYHYSQEEFHIASRAYIV